MADLPVELRRVDESCWRTYRDVRLAMLLDTPSAFASTYAGEAAFPDDRWLERVRGPARTWLAVRGDLPVGSVTSFRFEEQDAGDTCLVGMWVAPHARGSGVGEALVGAVLEDARERGLRRVVLDVAQANTSARRLYERMGFRATGRTGTLPWDVSVAELEMSVETGAGGRARVWG